MPAATSVLAPNKFETFGDLLTYLRKRARLTQEELGRAVGYSRAQITRLEKNQRLPDPATLVALFIPALELEAQPELARQMIEWAVRARGAQRVTVTHTIQQEITASVSTDEIDSPGHGHWVGLPVPLLPLIGRADELAHIETGLANPAVRLLTLLGPPGVGKTRLAVQAAAAAGRAFAGGVCFVNLAPLADPAQLPSSLLQMLAVPEPAACEAAERLLAALRPRHLLLVLDNFEHILDAAPLVAELLAQAAGLKVLITSRSPLQLYGEYRFVVPPLPLPDLGRLPALPGLLDYPSIALFAARAQAVKPDFAVTPANALAVSAICARLDGLPLAIELAAAQSDLFTPAAVLRGLVAKQPLLGRAPRNVPERQRSLAQAIAWSFQQLGPVEQQLLAWLGVFVGGFSWPALAAFNLSPHMQPALAALVDRSLVQAGSDPQDETRFTLLETIRAFALEQLAARGERDAARQKHLHYFTALAERADPELDGADQAKWLSRLQVEHDNFRAALAWAQASGQTELELRLAGALWTFWHLRGYVSEGRGRLQAALAHTLAAEPPLLAARAVALTGLGWMTLNQSDYSAAQTSFAASLSLFQALGDQKSSASALNNLGLVARHQGDHAQAVSYFQRSLAMFREVGGRQGISWALSNLGLIAMEQGDYAAARPYMTEGLALVRALSDQVGIARALNNLGLVAYGERDYASAKVDFDESLAIKRQLGNRLGLAPTLENLANVALRQGDEALARRHIAEALTLSLELGQKRNLACGLEIAADVAQTVGQGLQAARLLAAAAELRLAIGLPLPPVDQAESDSLTAAIRAALGDTTFAAGWQAGRVLTPEQAVASALLWLGQ